MKTVKKAISLFLFITMISLLPLSAMAATTQVVQYVDRTNGNGIEPYYINILNASLSRGKTWVNADMETYSKMSLRIDIKIYKNGSLDFSDYTTANNSYCVLDVDYTFIPGVSYKIEATYKAGTESVPKSMSFTA